MNSIKKLISAGILAAFISPFFYGVSLVNTACFPDSVSAIIVAKRLRKLGVNLVRFWGWDYQDSRNTKGRKRTTGYYADCGKGIDR